MEILAIGALVFAVLVAAACVFLVQRAGRAPQDDGTLARLREELALAQRERGEASEARARAETRMESS